MHAFISRCFSLHAHAFLLVIFPPHKPTNCNSTAIVPTGFLKFSLISVQAMFIDFGLAKETGGGCYLRWVSGVVWFWLSYCSAFCGWVALKWLLIVIVAFHYMLVVAWNRFDDTNPEAEKQEYIDHIQNIVSWLGWKPFKVPLNDWLRLSTFSSICRLHVYERIIC